MSSDLKGAEVVVEEEDEQEQLHEHSQLQEQRQEQLQEESFPSKLKHSSFFAISASPRLCNFNFLDFSMIIIY